MPREGLSGGLILARRTRYIIYDSKNLVHVDCLDNKGTRMLLTLTLTLLIIMQTRQELSSVFEVLGS